MKLLIDIVKDSDLLDLLKQTKEDFFDYNKILLDHMKGWTNKKKKDFLVGQLKTLLVAIAEMPQRSARHQYLVDCIDNTSTLLTRLDHPERK